MIIQIISWNLYNINGKSLFRLNTEVLVEFGDGSAISIRKILHQLAFLQQEDAGGDVGNEVEVMAGDDDRGAQTVRCACSVWTRTLSACRSHVAAF